jgi:hypothetical protein
MGEDKAQQGCPRDDADNPVYFTYVLFHQKSP